jgi:hypothetical protein
MSDDLAFDDWCARAKSADIMEVAERLGAKLKRAGAAERIGPCPKCGGTDRFAVNVKESVFNCRGAGGGGVADMVMHAHDCNFVQACEFILQEAPPNREATYRAPDPAIVKERREERKDAAAERDREEQAKIAASIRAATELFEKGIPIFGTIVEDYLDRRGLRADQDIAADLRMIPNLPYYGYPERHPDDPEDASAEVILGEFHCMIAAARNAEGMIQGIHRTYLAPDGAKLKPPGNRFRNKAKKGTFRMGGALIHLGAATEMLAMAEGIESALSWRALARSGEFGEGWADCPVAAAYSLGNMSGQSVGTIPHPTKQGRTLPSAEPNMASAAAPIPAGVKTLLLLGDGDSDPAQTRAMLRLAAARYRLLGLEVFIHMAGDGVDFNDVLLAQGNVAA